MIKNINFTHVITIAFTCGVIAVFYHFYNLKNDIKITVTSKVTVLNCEEDF